MKRLITYMVTRTGTFDLLYGHQVTDKTPVEWLEGVQPYDDEPSVPGHLPEETYLILNVLEITEAEAGRIDGALAGM